MNAKLLTLRNLVSGTPKLTRNNGAQVISLGDNLVCFPKEDDAPFFVHAYFAVPALIQENEELKRQVDAMNAGELERQKALIEQQASTIATLNDTVLRLENTLTDEAAKLATSTTRGKALPKLLTKLGELQRQVDTLNDELGKARAIILRGKTAT